MTGFALATLNASMNLVSATCLLCGYAAIRAKRVQLHRGFMVSAFVASIFFLAGYLTRMWLYGDTRFTGEGAIRYVYFAILISHIVLAIAVVPLVLRTLQLALKKRFAEHKKLAPWTFGIWAYVSVTGVTVYLMLY